MQDVVKELKILYRIKINATKNWYFVCKECTNIEKKNNKHYVYGGTWKGLFNVLLITFYSIINISTHNNKKNYSKINLIIL